ncbi:MAG: PEP-CTERM sorting domain-containing protein [Gloeocapsa sp. DLM2.Bin57]|nr:MAG: PEP-CTERM sorting domain-containing protein [Gloeocapsa sp. DLM2.Bin57]
MKKIISLSLLLTISYSPSVQATTVVRDWVQQALNAVKRNPSTTGPTIASRAYGILSTAMYDAWSAYEEVPISTTLGDDLQRPQSENNPENKAKTMSFAAYRVLTALFPSEQAEFANLMTQYGYNPHDLTKDITTPEGIGNVVAETLMEFRRNDASNQLSNYVPVNTPNHPVDITRWTPEHVPIDNFESSLQEYLTPHWGEVIPFGLENGSQFRPNPPEPFLLDNQASADLINQTITRRDGTVVEISPDLVGIDINPNFIAQAEQVVEISQNLTDEQKAIAEFWEDGGGTYYPPGHWLEFGLEIAQRNNHSLDQDILLFFPLSNALFDTGIATWEAKLYYDYARPVRVIRDLARLGLIDESQIDFVTYQDPFGDPSPPFPEYTSGHSGFSAAGAQVLRLFTGSDYLGVGVTIEDSRFFPGSFRQPVSLYWETFTDAEIEAGISRLYGGIHFEQGNLDGGVLGRQVGETVWSKSRFYINGGEVIPEPSTIGGSVLLINGLLVLRRYQQSC